jgi:hypothetical protein
MNGRRKTIVGKWRIASTSGWDRASVDLVEPGYITFATLDAGEMAFGVVTASLSCAFDKAKTDVSFEFSGSDEGEEISGEGWAELTESDTIHGEIAFDNGDETEFEARRW